MKKNIINLLICLTLLVPVVSYAQQLRPNATSQPCTNTPSTTLCNPIRISDSLPMFGIRIVEVFSTFFAFFALVYLVYSGFRMIVSQGDSEELTVAKNAFMWSILGLILGMFAFVLITATGTFIGARDPNTAISVGNHVVINPLYDDTFALLLQRILTGFLGVAGLIAILLMVMGGFRYITSSGNEEMAESGKKTLEWSVLGLIVIILSYVLVRATLTFFGN
ncbi:MAG TPA: hypothetical protein VF974_01945 [Patescibacteria group bacterium]